MLTGGNQELPRKMVLSAGRRNLLIFNSQALFRLLNVMFHRIVVLLFLVMSCASDCGAQFAARADHWYFARHAGMRFDAAGPVALSDAAINTVEGSASISDADGQLQIYTDGIRIWNRLHQVINGADQLGGSLTSTQSALIVPWPGSLTRMLVFSVDSEGGPKGVSYVVVDMQLNGGLGGISQTATRLLDRSTEKITAVQHCNGRDYWIIVHEAGNASFRVWLLTAAGLSSAPQIITVGTAHDVQAQANIGYLKASPNGRWLAIASFGGSFVEMFRFNNATGLISEPFLLNDLQWTEPYGLEFSPGNQFIYVSGIEARPTIFQFDLSRPTPQSIRDSRVAVAVENDNRYGALQTGPDGRIYVAKNAGHYLAVIHEPDQPGIACSFADDDFFLGTGESAIGLPSFVPAFFAPLPELDLRFTSTECTGAGELAIDLSHLSAAISLLSINWLLDGNPLSGQTGPRISAAQSGKYTAQIRYTVGCSATIESTEESIDLLLTPTLIETEERVSICEGQSYQGYQAAGVYTDRFQTTGGCDSSRTLFLEVMSFPAPVLGPEQTICPGQELVLYPGQFDRYQWQDGSVSDSLRVNRAGIYSVQVFNTCGAATATVELMEKNCTVYFPGAFTPNGDGRNDLFRALNADQLQSFKLQVFNRNGEQVFVSSHPSVGWDGRFRGMPQATGVFIWLCSYREPGGKFMQRRGTVTLVR